MEFKIGDRVEVKDCFDGLHLKGKKGTVVCIDQNLHRAGVEFDEDFQVGHNLQFEGVKCCTNMRGRWGRADQLLLIGKKSLKIPSHLVVWITGSGDSYKFFTNIEEVDEFVRDFLVENSGVVKNSIILIEIKSAKTVSIVKNLKSKQYKI